MLERGIVRRGLVPGNFAGRAGIVAMIVFECIGVVAWCGCSRRPRDRAAADPMPAPDPIVISSVGYDDPTRVLVVTLSSGAVYEYYGVPHEVYLDFIDAPSLNLFFAAHIRGRYRYRPDVVSQRLPQPYPRREFEPVFRGQSDGGRSTERERGGFMNYPPGRVYRGEGRRNENRGLEAQPQHRIDGARGRRRG